MKREFRIVRNANVRAAQSDNKRTIEGYAAVFNVPSEDMGWFGSLREIIKPGAFARSLKDGADVRCLWNHDANHVLGRNKSGTLDLKEDDKGLFFRCDLPDTQVARDLHASIERGDVDQCSFGFVCKEQNWKETKNEDGTIDTVRELLDVDLFDVSPVTYPAYPQTSVAARAMWPDGMPTEVRDHLHQEHRDDDCECQCPECMDGDCQDCSDANCEDPNCEGHERSLKRHRSETPTKRVDGEDLTADCFLIVGDPKDTSTWKLPWKFSTEEKTKSHLRNALARFDQLKDLSDEDKAKAKKKLLSLCKKYDIDVSAEEGKSSQAEPERADPPPPSESEEDDLDSLRDLAAVKRHQD